MPRLTKHPEGSLRELWTISFPLMLSSFSIMLMLFVDRLLLAHFSTSALNAAVNASTLGWAFTCGLMILTSIAEVFVAQYNGANHKKRLGEPVWQMIWLAIGSFFFFFPLALWGTSLFYGYSGDHQLEKDYFRWMMFFGPSYPLYSALASFFVGQGKTFLITSLAIITNFLNALLDIILIFGIEGYLPSLGIKGAAIATSSSVVFQATILIFIFLNSKNRKQHNTGNYSFQPKLFFNCLKIGLPASVFVGIKILGFATFYWMMTVAGEVYITIAGINQSIHILLYFIAEGVQKAVTVIAGNFIGARRFELIPRILAKGIRLHLIFFAGMLALFFIGKDIVFRQFLPDTNPDKLSYLSQILNFNLLVIIISLLFDGICLLLIAILTAAGDTTFLLVSGSLSIWVLFILPTYLIVFKGNAGAEIPVLLYLLYIASVCLIYYYRFLQGKWKKGNLIDIPPPI